MEKHPTSNIERPTSRALGARECLVKLPSSDWLRRWFLLMLAAWLAARLPASAGRLEVLTLDSVKLRNNPLQDPATRQVAVFLPDQITNGKRLPLVYYLPGFGGSPGNFINNSNIWSAFTQKLADELKPVVLVVVDGRTRWGGSQYLNSPAQGNYEDYICEEIVAAVEARYPAPTQGVARLIAGHSSGGFGALRLGSSRPKLFQAVIALSPDSDFPTSHLPLVTVPGVTNVPLAEIKNIMTGKSAVPKDGDLIYALALSAAYAPRGQHHAGEFDWLYDAHGQFRDRVWQRWLDNDPLTMVQRDPQAFSPGQVIYLDGAARDEYSANIGARKIYEALLSRPNRCAFYEPPGHHADHVRERLQRGLAWVWGGPVNDLQ